MFSSDREKFFSILVDQLNASVRVDGKNGRIVHYILKYNQEPKKRAEMLEKVIMGTSDGTEEINALDGKHKATPLHWARSKEDVTQLISYGAKLEEKSSTQDRALHIMVSRKRADAAYTLILNGAEINRPGNEGNTPLHYACQRKVPN